MDSNIDLQAKYQRLGQEYQKVRGQVTVLKKAVIDEQAINRSHQETLKQRDQTVRKYEQDIDSLEFRNSQLSKRVEVLQAELDEYERKGVKNFKGVNDSSSVSVNLVQQKELEMRILENEALHKQLEDATQQYQTVIRQLESKLEVLERDRDSNEKNLENTVSKHAVVMERLKEEQALLEAKLRKQDEELKFANIMAEKYQQQLKGVHKELRSKLDETTKLMQEKLPFIDTENEVLNALNIPVFDKAHQATSHMFIENLTKNLSLLMAGLSDYHTYMQQRLQAYSVDVKQEVLSAVNSKFSKHLLANASYTRKVQHAAASFCDLVKQEPFLTLRTLPGLQVLGMAIRDYVIFVEVLLPYRVLSAEEECYSSSWSETLEKCSNCVLAIEKAVAASFKTLLSYVLLLMSADTPFASISTCIKKIAKSLLQIADCFKALGERYSEKSSEEHQLPTYTERLKITDQCFLSAIRAIEISSRNLYDVFQEHVSFMTMARGFKRKGISSEVGYEVVPVVKTFHNQAVDYMRSIQVPLPPSVPYAVAVNSVRSFTTSTGEEDALSKQLLQAQETVSRLEQEKEHWMLEAQLMKAKQEKEQKKVSVLMDELKKLKLDSQQRGGTLEDNMSYEAYAQQERGRPIQRSGSAWSILSTISSPTGESVPQQTQFGTLEIFNKEKSGSVDSDHETLVKDHLSSRIAQLTKQLQQADSKCVNVYAETHALYKQLVLADRHKQRQSKELEDKSRKLESLQDELETTKRSYEDQLRMLSDHLCGMNEKLTEQKDEIDQLKTGVATEQAKTGKFQLPGRKR